MQYVTVIDTLPSTPSVPRAAMRNVPAGDFPMIVAGASTFDAAQLNDDNFRNWGHVKPETPEEIIDPLSLERLRSRAIAECLNDDALNGMINVSAESVVHCGPKLQIRIEKGGKRVKELEQQVERLWMKWTEKTRYFIKMRTAVKDLRNYGQLFRRLVYNPRIFNCLDVIYHNPMRVANPDGLENGESVLIGDEFFRMVNGVAYDRFGNESYFCVLDRPIYPGPYETWNYEWVSRSVMVRYFDPQFSEQPDGFPWATPSLEKGAFRRSYEKSETKAAQLAASLFGQVVTDNDFITFFSEGLNEPDNLPGLDAMRKYPPGRKVGLENGSFPIMAPGTKMDTLESQHPHTTFDVFTRTLQKGQGRPLRMPGAFATGDYSNTAYASAMKDDQGWAWHREVERGDLEIVDLKETAEKFVAVQSTLTPSLAALATGEAEIVKIDFDWRQSDHADPLKLVTSRALEVKTGLKSFPHVWAEMQLDPDDYVEEVLEWFEKMKPVLMAQAQLKEQLQSRARSQRVEKPA